MLFYNLTEPLRRTRKNWDMRSSFCSVFIFTVQNIRKYQCFKADYRPIKRLKIRPQEGGPGPLEQPGDDPSTNQAAVLGHGRAAPCRHREGAQPFSALHP